jgi:hypothetical protein
MDIQTVESIGHSVQFPKGDHTKAQSSVVMGSKPYGVVSLLDMLKRYAFSFYEVVMRIEQLRLEARSMSGASSTAKVYEGDLDRTTAALVEMRAECEKLDLTSTADLISHIESTVKGKSRAYTYGDLFNHLDTLSVLFAQELRRKTCFRIAEDKTSTSKKTIYSDQKSIRHSDHASMRFETLAPAMRSNKTMRATSPHLALTGRTSRNSTIVLLANSCSLKMLGEITLCMCVMYSTKARRLVFLVACGDSCRR